MKKKCYKCKESKHNNQFYKNSSKHDGYQSLCKACSRVRDKTRLPYLRRVVTAYYVKYPERGRAHTLVFNALKKGVLKKEECKVCGSKTNVEGHHKDYSKPLDVVWLCKVHHCQADKNIIKV